MSIAKSHITRFVLLVVSCLFFMTSTVNAAFGPEQRRVMQSGPLYFNTEKTPECTPSSVTVSAGGGIYVLGDSLTVGMRDSGGLDAKLRQRNWQPTKINAVVGQSLGWGVEQIAADSALIASSNSILVGLGTNNIGGDKTATKGLMQQLYSSIKSANPNIQIFWTNFYLTGERSDGAAILNDALGEVATENSFTVIPWSSSTEASGVNLTDGIHPGGNGYEVMAGYVAGQVGTAVSNTNSSAGSCCNITGGGSSNQQRVFNFFVSNGYTPDQAAGVVGNMIHESGVTPKKLQGEYGKEVGSQAVDINTGLGWGLVQWTPARKIIQASLDAGKTYEEIDTLDYQLQFLWEQLSGTGLGGAVANEKSAGDKMLTTTNVDEAAIGFGHWYERFENHNDLSNPRYTERVNAARQALAELSGGVSSASTTCSSLTAGANGWDLPGEGDHPMVYYSQMREASAPEDPAVQGYFGDAPYGEGDIAGCGCGPTSWAMIVSTLTGNKVEPPEVAAWAHENGFRSGSDACSGSAWWWTGNASVSEQKWGVRATQIQIDQAADYLKQGKLILVSVGAGSSLLSSGGDGHLLVMRAVTSDGKFLFADPSDGTTKRANGGDGSNPDIFKEFGSSSRTPLDAATVSSGLKGLFVVEKI